MVLAYHIPRRVAVTRLPLFRLETLPLLYMSCYNTILPAWPSPRTYPNYKLVTKLKGGYVTARPLLSPIARLRRASRNHGIARCDAYNTTNA